MKTLKTALALLIAVAWCLAITSLFAGCAFNKVTATTTAGTNTVTLTTRSYAIWPATTSIEKQKLTAGKTVTVGTEGLEARADSTNLVSALAELRQILQLMAR